MNTRKQLRLVIILCLWLLVIDELLGEVLGMNREQIWASVQKAKLSSWKAHVGPAFPSTTPADMSTVPRKIHQKRFPILTARQRERVDWARLSSELMVCSYPRMVPS